MMEELKKLRELTEELTGNGYLRDQADEWEYALDAMPEFVFIINTQYVIKFINKALSDTLHAKSKDTLFNKKIMDVLRIDESFIINNVNTTKQGTEVFLDIFNKWFLCYFEPIKASGGIIIGFICFLINITERKFAELHLIDSENKFSLAFKTSPYALTITRVIDGKFIEVNDAFTKLSGYSIDDISNLSLVSINLWVSIEDRNSVLNDLLNNVKVINREYEFKTKSGNILFCSFSASTIEINNEKCVLSSIADMTAYKRRSYELAEITNNLKNSEKNLKTKLLSIMDSNKQIKKVLVVDDEPDICELIRLQLVSYGYAVVCANDGQTAIEKLIENKPDLLLVDLGLKNSILSGQEVIEKTHDMDKYLPIVIVSGTPNVIDINSALKAGAWDYISKPIIVWADLIHTVQRNLEYSALIKESVILHEYLADIN